MDEAAQRGEVAAIKRSLRETALHARRQLSIAERHEASARAVERLIGLPELRVARTVLLYAAMSDEIDPSGLVAPLKARDVRILLPRVRDDRLELAAVAGLDSLSIGYRGIREPVGPAVDPSVVDLAVVPGVAFDPEGGRLGHGGGHYDRLLPTLADEAWTVGLCHSCQIVPRVAREAHDVTVDAVVTERAVHRPRRG